MSDKKSESGKSSNHEVVLNVGPAAIPFPLLDEYIIYRKYLLPSSIYMNEKFEHWRYELLILIWANSSEHQHYNAPIIHQERIENIILKESEDVVNSELQNIMAGQYNKKLPNLTETLGNIYQKGLAMAILNADIAEINKAAMEYLKDTNQNPEQYEEQIKQYLHYGINSKFHVFSIKVNESGMRIGKVASYFYGANGPTTKSYVLRCLYAFEPLILWVLVFAAANSFTSSNLNLAPVQGITTNAVFLIGIWITSLTAIYRFLQKSIKRIPEFVIK